MHSEAAKLRMDWKGGRWLHIELMQTSHTPGAYHASTTGSQARNRTVTNL